jgi:heptosyltransferase-1
MKVLLIKMSSLGDVLHTLPALEDAYRKKKIEVTWVVEPSFQEIAQWHPAVKRVIPLPFRSIRKNLWQSFKEKKIQSICRALREESYDMILDAQGLLKSALVTQLAKGPSFGLDKASAREPLASYLYDKTFQVERKQHAVVRLRQLFSKVFEYSDDQFLSYGIQNKLWETSLHYPSGILFLHGTTWESKHWPEAYWCQLAQKVSDDGFQVLIPWGNQAEYERAVRIQQSVTSHNMPIVLEKMSLAALAGLMKHIAGAIAVDTGLGHLAAALDVPCLSVYGPTSQGLTGAYGLNQMHMQSSLGCAPCFQRTCTLKGSFAVSPPCLGEISPEQVWGRMSEVLQQSKRNFA